LRNKKRWDDIYLGVMIDDKVKNISSLSLLDNEKVIGIAG
jgi:hypothetical protein